MPSLAQIIEAAWLALSVNAPIQVIITIGQWLLMARFLTSNTNRRTIRNALSCLALTYISAYAIALPIWLFWPFDPELILYNNRISMPAVIGEAIAMPFWLYRFGYFKRQTLN